MVALVETQRSTWDQIREDFELGKYVSLLELSERYKVNYQVLRNKIHKQKWKEPLITKRNERLQKIEEVKEDLASSYLKRTFKRAERYEKLIDLSQEQLCAMSGKDGLPVLDPDALLAYAKVETATHALAKSALRISDKLDIQSGGQDLGASFVSAIAKLRESNLPKLTDEDYDAVMSCEVVPD